MRSLLKEQPEPLYHRSGADDTLEESGTRGNALGATGQALVWTLSDAQASFQQVQLAVCTLSS